MCVKNEEMKSTRTTCFSAASYFYSVSPLTGINTVKNLCDSHTSVFTDSFLCLLHKQNAYMCLLHI